ncbi:MAG: GAF domain-containing sensor histidine kinase [Candidatus Omnitrophica bacterium]|nr:GAF domain-containing sensor histidine kinase [Candidatus Omnitrophota bacterium]
MAEISRAELKYFVERQREEIKTLNEVGKILSSTTDPQEIIRLTASYLHRAFPVALCGILFLPRRRLHMIPFAPIAPMDLNTAIRQIREKASALLRRPVTEEDSVCPEASGPSPGWLQPSTPLRSQLVSPLTVQGQAIGALSLFSGQAEAFTQEDQHAIGIVADQLGAALRNAFLVEELRRADELKNQLLSIVSHELSTPLTAIKEGVNLILDGALGDTTPDQKDFLGTVNENADRLERLIQKIKTATELMTGQSKFSVESFDLRTLLANVEKIHRPLATTKNVHLKIMDHPKPLFWPIDTKHLTVAVSQILENAIQATPAEGLVTAKLTASGNEVEIQVVDTGAGIAHEALPTLFEQFKSIGDIHNRKMGGLGLGLFIAKALVKGHGGTITVESSLGQGTVMTIRLPKQNPSASP